MTRQTASESAFHGHSPGRLWLLGGLLCLLCASTPLFYSHLTEEPDYWPVIGIGTAIAALCIIASLRVFGFGWQSAPVGYVGLLWMFHFPMTLFVHLNSDLWTQLPAPIYRWTQHYSWYRASVYAFLCVIAFVIGCGIASSLSKQPDVRAGRTDITKFQVGTVTALCGVAWLYYLMIRQGGFDLFGNSYAQMFSSIFGPDFTLAIFVVSVGCFIALLSAPSRLVWLPVVLQISGSVPVLLTGARQFALIGPFVLAVVAAKRGMRLGLVRTGGCCVLILWMISYVGETRSHGVVEGVVGARQVGPVNALLEMGGSLQTTSLTLDWIQNGDRYLLGGSYWLPFERGLGLLLPLRTDLGNDPRAMDMVLVSRTSGLGGSAVAESFYNFSVFGTLFFLALGFLLARLQLTACSPVSAAMMSVVLYAFMFQARNWFISVPMLIFLGSLPVLACSCLEYVARRREFRTSANFHHHAAGMRSGPRGHWAAGRSV